MGSNDPAVDLRDASAGYRGRAVLRDVSVVLHAGHCCALIGANGAGKSTLLKLVAGLCEQQSGSVRLFGQNAHALDRRARARLCALVPQSGAVAAGFSVREVVAMGRAPHQRFWLSATGADREIVEKTLAECELLALADRRLETLSGGEQQRVAIARALAQQAPILLLDEAAAHLDLRHAAASRDLLRRLAREKGLCCIAAMHDLAAAARWADRAAILCEGRLLAVGPPREAMTCDRLEAAFGTPIVATENDGQLLFAAAHRAEVDPDDMRNRPGGSRLTP